MGDTLTPGESVAVATPAFPAVNPFAPGVPPVATPAIDAVATVPVVTADGVIPSLFADPLQFGYYKDGIALCPDTSVVAFEFRRDEVVCSAPQEAGAFLDYNKVSNPFTAKVRYALAGDITNRAALFDKILEAEESLDLYDLVMPEVTFSGVNITRHDFQRTSRNGVTMVQVDVYCEEIREAGDAVGTVETATPAGAPGVIVGPVQAVPAPPAAALTIPPNPAGDPGDLPATTVVLTTRTGNAAGGTIIAAVPTTRVVNVAAII